MHLKKYIHEQVKKLLHVSAPGCHHQGFIQNKGVQAQNASVGNYVALIGMIKMLIPRLAFWPCTPLFCMMMAPQCRNM
jgi:hypothetical protein